MFLKNKHIQTIYASLFRKFPSHEFVVERFTLSDGDFLEPYWYKKPSPLKPIVILFHGLSGSYKSPYIHGLMQELDRQGYNSVVMHFRTCSGVMNLKETAYHSGKTDDAIEFIDSVKKRFPISKLFSIGFSLGGNMLLKLLGELGDKSPFSACISVSAPMQLDIGADKINSGFSKIYQRHLLKNLNQLLEQKYEIHDMESLINIKKEDVKNISSFWEFDDVYTAKIHGFESAQDYYTKCSSKQYLKNIKTDTLIIYSLDDPFMTPEILPNEDEISKFVKLEIHKKGGHVGFIEGSLLRPKYYLETKVPKYFNNFI
ncbi:MAG: hydrolase [Campylobacterota bacterium]|nr:hydrolase [Campylobacterota bacterium]